MFPFNAFPELTAGPTAQEQAIDAELSAMLAEAVSPAAPAQPATETYEDSATEPAAANGAPDTRLRRRYGAIQVPLPAFDRFAPAIIPSLRGEIIDYDVYILTPIMETTDFANTVADLVQILDYAPDAAEIRFHIASPGGSVDLACRIISAMNRSRARVITSAIGLCASAGSFIWSYGHERRMEPGAVFMFHMSKHSDQGHSPAIELNARHISNYIKDVALNHLADLNILTEDEVEQIVEGRREIYLDAGEMTRRLTAGAA